MKIDFFGYATAEGEFVHETPGHFAQHMRESAERNKEGKPPRRLLMTVKPFRKPRSTGKDGEGNQNGYYWAVIVRMVADEIGELDQDLVHEWIQLAVGNFKVMPDGTKVPLGTSVMDTAEAEEYYARARMWAAAPGNVCEQGLFIPLPNEADYA